MGAVRRHRVVRFPLYDEGDDSLQMWVLVWARGWGIVDQARTTRLRMADPVEDPKKIGSPFRVSC